MFRFFFHYLQYLSFNLIYYTLKYFENIDAPVWKIEWTFNELWRIIVKKSDVTCLKLCKEMLREKAKNISLIRFTDSLFPKLKIIDVSMFDLMINIYVLTKIFRKSFDIRNWNNK